MGVGVVVVADITTEEVMTTPHKPMTMPTTGRVRACIDVDQENGQPVDTQ